MATYRDVAKDALLELNQIDAEEDPTAADAQFVLGKLARILDRWNARGVSAYATTLTTLTLTPSLQPHTIGPSAATFVATVRPERLLGAVLVEGDSRTPLHIHTVEWWQHLSSRTMTGRPSDLYYSPDWPNGSLYFWPVPDSAVTVELAYHRTFAPGDADSLNDTFSFPPGFRDALTLTLAEEIAPAFGAQVSPVLMEKARDGRAQLFSNHGKRYPMRPDLAGRGYWDYRTGEFR